MRDIRADLRERLEAAQDAEQAARDRVRLLKEMLDAEEARVAFTPPGVTGKVTVTGTGAGTATVLDAISALHKAASGVLAAPSLPLDDFLVKAVRRGVHDKEELRDAAIRGGYFPDNAHSPGRVIHAKLLHLVRQDILAQDGDSYAYKEAAE